MAAVAVFVTRIDLVMAENKPYSNVKSRNFVIFIFVFCYNQKR